MGIGDEIARLIEACGLSKKEIALEWMKRWNEQAGKDGTTYGDTSVQPRLSNLLAEDQAGLKHFYGDGEKRWRILHEILGTDEHERLCALAKEAQTGLGQREPRVVVLLAGGVSDAVSMKAVFTALKERVLERDALHPVQLVLTDAQYDCLPRTFDDYEEGLRTTRVADGAAGVEEVQNYSGDGWLLVGPEPLVEPRRWVALDVDKTARMWPESLLASFAETLSFPAEAVVEYPLTDLAIEASDVKVPVMATEVRRAMTELGDPERAAEWGDAGVRLGLAQALNVVASSTEQERTDAAIAGWEERLGLTGAVASQDELDALLKRAARRVVEPTAMRVGDVLHVVNPSELCKDADGYLKQHVVERVESAYSRLSGATNEWTVDDAMADPFMEHVMAALEEDGLDRAELEHARTTLQVHGYPKLVPLKANGDWRMALKAVLANPAPEASLWLESEVGRPTELPQFKGNRDVAGSVYLPTTLRFESERDTVRVVTEGLAQCVARVGPMVWQRGQIVDAWSPASVQIREKKYWYVPRMLDRQHHYGRPIRGIYPEPVYEPASLSEEPTHIGRLVPHLLVPVASQGSPPSDNKWMDAMEASLALGANPEGVLSALARGISVLEHPAAYGGVQHRSHRVDHSDYWEEQDRDVACIWLALRVALARGVAEQTSDGRVLLPHRGDTMLELLVRHRPDGNDGVFAAFEGDAFIHIGAGEWRIRIRQFKSVWAPISQDVAGTLQASDEPSVAQ